MVARVIRYFGAPVKVQNGVTQGDPISPMVFNVVVYSVLWHWIYVEVEVEGEI